MSLSAKREYLARMHGRYQRAGRLHKTRILDEPCALCGYHHKATLRLLNRPLSTTPPRQTGPKIIYEPAQVLPILKAIWLASAQKDAMTGSTRHHEVPRPERSSSHQASRL